ncbi:DUF2975 domain-containing protein [Sphingomonas sp. MMS12-HWE2-04]|uniref:DUF2975 domain-containing protein n=1 Tax=Sphingomonas sp. MMS12-HWE2-04 TaxID=3234199 RepID=UPI00384AD06C
MKNRNGLIHSSALALRLASFADWAFGAAVLAGLAASATLGGRFTTLLLGEDGGAALDERTAGIRWLMVLGIAMAGLIFVMLRALRQIVATVMAGDPFVLDNAARLRTIGWSLVAIQLLDIPAVLIARGFPALGSAAPDAGISPAGWLAVLMSFVLARVFVVGAGMRDDLEGTV